MLEPAFTSPNPRSLLSPRELEVLEMASLGLTNWQIAARLQVTVHAVKFHLAGIYRKLGVTNRTEAAVMFLRADRPYPLADAGDVLA
ncbi:MAG: helix-turn-helix transcriptional regulator [Actinomycetota bacterium]|nr:helix-turn-helix transcriptional regulator [Actinomycetota bacterium]